MQNQEIQGPQTNEVSEIQQRKAEELTQEYLTWFKQEMINEEQTLQRVWLDRKKSQMISGSAIQFKCAISQQKVKFPVFYNFCVDQRFNDLTHFDVFFDLTKLLIYIIDKTGRIKSDVNCPSCQRQQNIPPNMSDIQIIQRIIRPHMFIYNLMKQVGIYPKDIMYYYKDNIFFPTYKGKIQQNYWGMITPVFQVPLKKEAQFFQIAQRLQDYQGSEITNICLISQSRVNIPVRGKQCVHYEAYDLAPLFKHLNEQLESKRMKCVLSYCQSIFDLNDPNSFCIDYDLLKAGMQGLSFSMNFTYNPIYNSLSDSLLNRQQDEQISSYRQIDDFQENLDYLHKIYEFSENIFQNDQNKPVTTKFYENYKQLEEKLQDNLFRCEITNLGIQIPARCRNCRGIKVCDVRLYACILHQVKNQQDEQGVFKKRLQCPLCGHQFLEKPKPPLTFFQQVYIDTEMMKFFVQTPFYLRTYEKFHQFLQNKPSQNSNEMRQQLKLQLDQLKRESYDFTMGMELYTFNFQCLLSGNRIVVPVRNKNCKHFDCFDRDSIKKLLDKNADLGTFICPSPQCQQPFGSIDNLFIDNDLYLIMQRQSAVIKYWNKGAVNLRIKAMLQM